MFRQLILSGVLGASLFISACGGGGGGAPSTQPPAQNNAVSGSATKGVIANGKVSAYAIRNNAVDGSKAIASTTTDAAGKYTLSINDYTGPVSIEIIAQADTTMLCDVPFGCKATSDGDIIEFGKPVPLANSAFTLRAFIPRVDKTISASITPLTHMAAQYAESQLANGDAATAIDSANSRVANLFKLDGDLLALAPPDITKANNTASKQANQYALLSAAFASIALSADKLAETINQAASNFSSHNGQLTMVDRDNSLGEITLASITGAALSMTSAAAAEGKLDSAVTNAAEELFFLNSLATDATEDSASTASSSATSGANELAKTKALIGDIRALASAGQNYLTLNGKNSLNSFEQKLRAAEPTIRNSADAFQAIKKAGLIAADFAKSIDFDSADKTSLLLDIYNASAELQSNLPLTNISADASISYTASSRTLVLTGVIDSVSMSLGIDVFHEDTGRAFPITIAGRANDGASRIEINELVITPTLYTSKTLNTADIEQAQDISLNDVSALSLKFIGRVATRKGLTSLDATVFAGGLHINYVTSNHLLEVNQELHRIYALQNIFIGGSLQAESESYNLSLSFTHHNAAQAIPKAENGKIIVGPYADPFATGGMLLNTELNIAGLGNTVVEVKVNRTGLETAAAQISFANTNNNIGRKITFATTGNFESDSITGLRISNQDNVQLVVESLSPTAASLKLNGTQYATISQVGSGLIKVTYSDGTFESFN